MTLKVPPTFAKLGTFPLTQQGVGLFVLGGGLVITIANVAKLFFNGIKKRAEENKNVLTTAELKNKIAGNKDAISHGCQLMKYGCLTLLPIIGTIYNGREWYKHYKASKV